MMRSGAKQSLTESTQGVIFKAMDHSAEFVKLVSGAEPDSPEEDARMSLLTRAMLRGFESQCYQYESGMLDSHDWQALQTAIRELCSLPGFNRYWQQLKPHMSERLKVVIDGKTRT